MSIKNLKNFIYSLSLEVFGYSPFDNLINLEDFLAQVLFETYIEESNNRKIEKQSLKSYVKGENENSRDSIYQKQKRTLKFSKYYKDKTIERFKERNIDISGLQGARIPNLNTISEKKNGYSLTARNYRELENLQNIDLFKLVLKKTITKSKNVSKAKFEEAFKSLDSHYSKLPIGIESIIEVYYLEKSIFADLAYRVASLIDQENLEGYDLRNLFPLFSINIPDINYIAENRFIYHRNAYIKDLLDDKKANNLVELVYFKSILLINCKEKILAEYNQIGKNEIANYILANYNLLEFYSYEKNWNDNKISIVRQLYDLYIEETPYPKIRT